MLFQNYVLVFILKPRDFSKEKEDSLPDCTERKQRAKDVTDFLMAIATYFLWFIKSENHFSFTDRPWFPFHSKFSSQPSVKDKLLLFCIILTSNVYSGNYSFIGVTQAVILVRVRDFGIAWIE